MSPDAFRRLALLAGSMALLVAIGCVWVFISWAVALGALLGAPLLAAVLTIEDKGPQPAPPEAPNPDDQEGLSHREIDRQTRRAA